MAVKVYKYVDEDLNSPENNNESEKNDNSFDANELEDDSDASENEENEENEDFQGIIRTVTGACLVYKRKDEAGSYEELWIYNVGGRDIKPEVRIRNSILAGTDIDPKTQRSPDGEQTCETITVGNIQFLHILGLPN